MSGSRNHLSSAGSRMGPLSISVSCSHLLGNGITRRGNGGGVAVDESVEPIKLLVQAFDQMLGFPRSRQVVIFAREENQFGRHAEMFERAKPLFALFQRDAEVVVGMQN